LKKKAQAMGWLQQTGRADPGDVNKATIIAHPALSVYGKAVIGSMGTGFDGGTALKNIARFFVSFMHF
jgi:hypothetical protein